MLPFRPNYRKVEIPSIVTRRQTRVLLGHTPKASEPKPDPILHHAYHQHRYYLGHWSDVSMSMSLIPADKRVNLIDFAVWFMPRFKKILY